jgi:uncharacterized protein YukE
VTPKRTGERAPGTQSAGPKAAAIRAAVIRLWKRAGGARSRSRDARREQRLETLVARVEHLEAELEGLQDAVHRQAVLEHDNIGDLRRRTEPEQLARDLVQDARRRGL